MKINTLQITLASLVATSEAFPHMALKMAKELASKNGKRQSLPSIPLDSSDYTGTYTTVFDADDQYVSNTGDYLYVAPGSGDNRGPCPGLNAMANHNYINHNGVTNLLQAIQGTEAVFNMAVDLGGFLSAYSVLFDGDLLTQEWSIGQGQADLTNLGGLLGEPEGLTGSHNKYESDSSPMRVDSYQFCGDNCQLQLPQYQQYYDFYKGTPDAEVTYSFQNITDFRNTRFQQSIAENPYFFYGPFTGLIVSQAAFTFIPAFMSNHSAEYPNGILSRQTMNSFMGVVEQGGTGVGDGTLVYTRGTESIPDNWYRRSSSNQYSFASLVLNIVRIDATYPEIFSIGGNINGVNAFTGLDLGYITGGVYNADTLFEGDNLQCFLYQNVQNLILDASKGLLSTVLDLVESLLGTYIDPIVSGLSCPTLESYDMDTITATYPGFGANANDACSP